MEVTDDRGIECRGLCFSYGNGEIHVEAYRDHPGVRRDLNEPYFHKHFSDSEWAEILDYLIQTRDAGPALVKDEEETPEEEAEEEKKEVEEEKATDGQA